MKRDGVPRFSWTFHLILAVLFVPVWFVLGGAIALGGSPQEMAIDAVGGLISLLYLGFAFIRTARGLARKAD